MYGSKVNNTNVRQISCYGEESGSACKRTDVSLGKV